MKGFAMNAKRVSMGVAGAVLLLCSAAWSESSGTSPNTVYVNNKTGSDDFSGTAAELAADGKTGPFKTIMQAVRQCAVGARIVIANTGDDYRETVSIEGYRKGLADAPLVIDGQGAYVSGLVELSPAQWVHFKDDIYVFPNKVGDSDFKPRGHFERKIGDAVYGIMPNSNWLGFMRHQGWFVEEDAPEIFLLNGVPGTNSLSLEAIHPGGFFYDAQSAVLKDLPGQRSLFFRLPEGKTLKECRVELPLNRGVYVSDDYVTVCNLGSRYSQDDGFAGFWGQGVVLRNIHACFNCDQGVSFHGNSTTLIDGALIERNAGCGIVDVMSSSTFYRNVTVCSNYPSGVLFSGFAHAMYHCQIKDNCGVQIQIDKGASGSLDDCMIVGRGDKVTSAAVRLEHGRINHCTIVNSAVGVSVKLAASIRNSIVADCPVAVEIDKDAVDEVAIDKTLLGLGEVRAGSQKIAQGDWESWVKEHARMAGAVIASPKLEGPCFQLSNDSPFLKIGENGTVPGVRTPFIKK
jgi:hypothetical protein